MSGIITLIALNVRRNFARSMLTVVGMGLAAIIMTASLTLSEGYPATAYGPYRDYCGGDVLVFADRLWIRATDVNEAAPGSWVFSFDRPDLPGPWQFFQPGMTTRGGVRPSDGAAAFSASALAELETALAVHAGVQSVRPYFTVPLVRSEFTSTQRIAPGLPSTSIDYAWHDSHVRAWRGGVWPELTPYVVSGRPLELRDEGSLVGLIDADRAKLARIADGYPSVVPDVGESLRLHIPRLSVTSDGLMLFDYTDPLIVDIEVVGHYSIPTREVSWINPQAAGDAGPAPAEIEQLYLTSPEIILPWQTASSLLLAASGGTIDVLATAIALGADSLARVESLVAEVSMIEPGLSVVSVPRLAAVANAQWLPEPVYRVPATEWAGSSPPAQLGEPVNISLAFNVIFFAVAALLAAANGIVLVLERQREIGILKAVGAYTRDVILMILGEIVLLAAIGAFAGFVLAETVAVWNLISNRTSFAAVLVTVGTDLVKVLGLTVSFAVVFGLAPALRTTRMTAMEVLRKE